MIFDNALMQSKGTHHAVTAEGIGLSTLHHESYSAANATRLADVSRCIEILSDDMAKLPWYLYNDKTKERLYEDPVLDLLRKRPNEAMTPSTFKKLQETSVLTQGNAYVWIVRDPVSAVPRELLPVPATWVTPHRSRTGFVWYEMRNPITGEQLKVAGSDVIHLKGWSQDGLQGVSVLRRARDIITGGIAATEYSNSFYQNGGHPAGVLQTDTNLTGTVKVKEGKKEKEISQKDYVRQEWEKVHGGAGNAFRIAVLDNGLKYIPLTISQADAQFVETRKLQRVDFANMFGVPLYKLNDGKQAYSSNEQNAVDYVGTTLQPKVTQWEEEYTWKLLDLSRLDGGWRYRMNMMAALRGDSKARADYYKTMREIGAFSVNDILALEDMPPVAGGDARLASLNYVPLEDFQRLSIERNGGKNGTN